MPKGKGENEGKSDKPIKLTPQKAAARLAEQVEPDLRRLMADAGAPAGVQAAPGDFGAGLKKALPHILTALIELGEVAADGQLTPDEVSRIAGKVFEFVRGFRAAPGA